MASKKTPPKPQSSQPLPLPVVKPTTGGIKPPPSKPPTSGKPTGGALATSGFPLPVSGDKQPDGQTLAQPSPDKPAVEKKGFDSSPFDDLAQRMTEQEARQKPSDVQRHIIRFDYPSFELERAAQGSELARQFLRRITHQRMTIDAFLDGTPSLEKALDKLFLKFGEDEEEDAALLKVARLYLRERAAQREVDAATTQEQEPETEPTPEEELRNFDQQYEDWVNQANALQAELVAVNAEIAALGNRIRLEGITPETSAQLDALSRRREEIEFQLDEINRHLESAVEDYIVLMETVFGYNLEIDPDFQGTRDERIAMITTLRDANFLIVDYLDDILEGTDMSGLEAFRQFFAQVPNPDSPTDYDTVVIYVGADDETEGPEYGEVPLTTECQPGDVDCQERRHTIYLGSNVSVATTVHEFFHQLDRYFGVQLSREGAQLGFDYYLNQLDNPYQTEDIQQVLTARANPSDDSPEIFADLGMTAVLHGTGETIDPYGGGSAVDFADSTRNDVRNIACAFSQYLEQLLIGHTSETGGVQFDPDRHQQCVDNYPNLLP